MPPGSHPRPIPAPQQASRVRRQESPSFDPLGFLPRTTPSVTAALASEVPAEQAVTGARPPRPGSSHRWGVAVSLRGQAAWFGRLDRQRAAVAADLSLVWRRCMAEEVRPGRETLGVGWVGWCAWEWHSVPCGHERRHCYAQYFADRLCCMHPHTRALCRTTRRARETPRHPQSTTSLLPTTSRTRR